MFNSSNAELSPERYWSGPRSLEVWEGVKGGGGRERERERERDRDRDRDRDRQTDRDRERRGNARIFLTLRCHHQNDSVSTLCLP